MPQLELSLRCENLRSLDVLSKSDALCIVLLERDGKYIELGKTEVLANTKNGRWATTVVVPHAFQEVQRIEFRVYDVDSSTKKELIGVASTLVSTLVVTRGEWKAELVSIKYATKNGTLLVATEELSRNQDIVTVFASAAQLPRADLMSSDPFLVLYRSVEGQKALKAVHTTEYVANNRSPTWKEFTIRAAALCGGDYDTPIIAKVYDRDPNKSEYMCETETSVQALAQAREPVVLALTAYASGAKDQPKEAFAKPAGATGKAAGTLSLKVAIERNYSALDYLQGGMRLALDVAIDFTASNGVATEPSSLHYMGNKGRSNAYMNAIKAVAEVIAQYDDDKRYGVYGFGAKVKGETNHAFSLGGDDEEEVTGIDGILAAYERAVKSVVLHGPTLLAQILDIAAAKARTIRDASAYRILFIVTDGQWTDLDACIDRLVVLAQLPISIVIIGVGNADFSGMRLLDADVKPLRARSGAQAERDCVNFVAVNEHPSIEALVREVLAEIPAQIEAYGKMKAMKPLRSE